MLVDYLPALVAAGDDLLGGYNKLLLLPKNVMPQSFRVVDEDQTGKYYFL